MLRRLALGALMLASAALPRHSMEATMLRHMLLQLPLIVAAGSLLGGRARMLRAAAWCDEHGIFGLSLLMFVSAYWMVPRALELSISSAAIDAAKFSSLLLTGALLPGSLQRANRIIELFFLGNFCAMTAIAGMQYQQLPQRLCNTYLLDDQSFTGMGLVAGAILISATWCIRTAQTLDRSVTAIEPRQASCKSLEPDSKNSGRR